MNVDTRLHRLTIREQLTLSTLWFSLNASNAALLPIVIPTQILLYVAPGQVGNAQQATFLGWISTLGAIMALFIPPFVGMASDRTYSTFGRRRPYIVVGCLLIALSVVVLIKATNVIFFVIGLGLFQAGTNVVTAAYQSLTPDLVPQDQRGAASGYMGLMTILGNVTSLALAAWLFGQISLQSVETNIIRVGLTFYYIFSIIVMLSGVLITIAGIHEAPNVPQPTVKSEGFQLRPWIKRNWIEPWHSYNFTLVFLTRSSVMMGLALFMTFIEYYFANVAHTTNFVQATAAVAILALLGAVVSAFTVGVVSDRVKRAPLVSMATIFMAVASFTFVILSGNFPLWPLGILFGLGYGAYTSVDWALSIDALPSMDTVGKDLGLWTASMTLPAIAAPLLGSLIITVCSIYGRASLGYRFVFATATLFLILAAICILFVRERQDVQNVQAPDSPQTASRRTINTGWLLAFQTRAGRAHGFLRFWPLWERFTRKIWHVQSIPHAPHNLMAIRLTHYSGQPIDLPDGVHVQSGDPIIELHFNNQELLKLAEQTNAWEYMQLIAQNLHALALWLQEPDFPDTHPQQIQAIYGLTLLSRGARRLGFTVRERPENFQAKLDRFFMIGLLVLYNPNGRSRLLQGPTYGTYPGETWMSRSELLKRYGEKDEAWG